MSIEVIEPSVVDVGVPHLVMVDHDAVVVIDGDEALVEARSWKALSNSPFDAAVFSLGVDAFQGLM